MGEPEDGRLGIDRRARAGARWGLAALVLGTVACLAVAVSNDPNPPFIPPKGATTDVDVFRKVATRVGRGDSFYDATQQEFRAHGYPTRSVFNWRTPIYAWFLGRVTGFDCGRWLLMMLWTLLPFAVWLSRYSSRPSQNACVISGSNCVVEQRSISVTATS